MEQPLQWDILVHNLSEAGLQECRLEARATLFVQIANCIYRNQNMYLSKLQILFVQIKECIFWGSWRIAKVQLSGLSNIAFCPALKLLSVWNWSETGCIAIIFVSCFLFLHMYTWILVAYFPAVFFIIFVFDICYETDKYKYIIMKFNVSWVGQPTRILV